MKEDKDYKDMMKTFWKVIVVLGLIFIFLLLVYLVRKDTQNKKYFDELNYCRYQVCQLQWNPNTLTYQYNENYKICLCYNQEGKIYKQKYLGRLDG